MDKEILVLNVEGRPVRLAVSRRTGSKPPIIFLHGFGSTKEDFFGITDERAFDDRSIIMYDAPGSGDSKCDDLSLVTIPFLRTIAEALLAHYGIRRFHLVGHSMGGLTALLLAHDHKRDVLSLTSVEGNLAPEDCFLSRQILDFPTTDPEAFLAAFIGRVRGGDDPARALYADNLTRNILAGAVEPIFRSMLELSDYGNLLEKFLDLPFAKMFMYGENNRNLSYIPELQRRDIRLEEIPHCGHFPMYSNPEDMWRQIAAFIEAAEAGKGRTYE